MTVADKAPEKALLDAKTSGKEELLYAVTRGRDFGRWLLLALAEHPDMSRLYRQLELPVGEMTGVPGQFTMTLAVCDDPDAVSQEQEDALETEPDQALLAEIRSRTAYRYPHFSATMTPSKLAASEVAEQVQKRENGRFSTRPRFIAEEGLTAAEKGNALHKFMQFCDYAVAAKNPRLEVERLVEQSYLTRAEGDSISLRNISRFFGSDLAKRIFRAEKVHRELRFLAVLGEEELSRWRDDIHGADTTTVQGVADCVFIKDNEAVIVDYKTDRVKDAESLLERYSGQLTLYKEMVEAVMGIKVTKCVIWSFELGQEIKVC